MRSAIAASSAGIRSPTVTRTTWSLKDAAGPVVENAGVAALKHSM